jgi:hypothetical protein
VDVFGGGFAVQHGVPLLKGIGVRANVSCS